MASLSYAISVTDALNAHIHTEIAKAGTEPPLADTEKAKSQLAKLRAITVLESTIATVDSTLSKLQQPRRRNAAATTTNQNVDDYVTLVNQPRRRGVIHHDRPMLTTVSGKDHAQNVVDQMSSKGMQTSVETLKDMAIAIQPIVTSFDKVLVSPHLKNYSASLNTVPVVGIKGNNIMYIEKKSTALGLGFVDNWAVFSSLPAGAVVAPDVNNIFMFPFMGDFCLALGQKVWRKAHRADTDVERAKAVDNWPKLYNDEWTKAGDLVLPSADLLGVVPFARLSADRRDLDFHLVVLKSDSSLAFLVGDSLVDNAKFQPLVFNGAASAAAPKFMRVAYWDDQIVGYDDANNIWNIKVDFTANTFSVADQTPDTAITELTATEMGPITVRGDGFLYRRLVAVKSDSSDKDSHYTWTKWIAQDGVSHLGVASPGVILDLNLLTRTLRSRYIDTQTALYPIVNKIKAFCTTHNVFLDKVQEKFNDYNNADDDEAKKSIAVTQGKAFIGHAKTWSKILKGSVDGSRESVSIMTNQLSNVHAQLETQLQILKDKLVGLQITLEAQKEAMDKLQASFWGSIAAAFLGLAIMVVGSATGVAILAGGALFVAGLVSAIVFGKKMEELAQDMADTKSQIDAVTTAIAEMTAIVDSYTDLNGKYGVLNMFWGRMQNEATSIGSMDDATLELIGLEVFEDDSSIVASKNTTTEMGDACTQYLDTLNKQGIKLPESSPMIPVTAPMLSDVHILSREDKQKLSQGPGDTLFHDHVHNAIQKLRTGDYNGYQEEMDRGSAVSFAANASAADLKLKTGLWLDVPALTSNATVWDGFRGAPHAEAALIASERSTNVPMLDDISGARGQLDGSLQEAKPYVVSMLQQTVLLGRTIFQWPRDTPTAGAINVDGAVDSASKALQSAAKAKNKFADFQQHATKFQQDRESDVKEKQNDINGEVAAAATARDNIQIPWYLLAVPFGSIAILEYKNMKMDEINRNLDTRVSSLQAIIKSLLELQQSGTSFHSSTLTWIQMCEQLSGNLGNIYNTLTAIEGLVLEDNDPDVRAFMDANLKSTMQVEWKIIVQDATTVLELLDVHTPLTVSSHLVPSGKLRFNLLGPAPAAAGPRDASSSSQSLVLSLSPGANLGTSLNSQADSAKKVFQALNVITQLPYVGGLVAFWDAAQVDRTTLLDVTNRVRTQYVQLVATEYYAVEKLYSLSVLQEMRAASVTAGKLPVDVFVKVTSKSFDVYESADGTLAKFDKSASEFDDTMVQVTNNLAYIQEQVAKLDVDISKLDKEKQDMVYSYIADVITSAVSSSIAFMKTQSPPSSGGGEEKPGSDSTDKKIVPPSVSSTILQAKELALNAVAMADNLKQTIKDLKLKEVTQLIHTMQLVKRDYDTTAKQLTAAQPLFHQLLDGLKDVMASVKESGNELQKILQNSEVLLQFKISSDDATYIGNEWKKVKSAAQSWLDTINTQGISPLTSSVRTSATHA